MIVWLRRNGYFVLERLRAGATPEMIREAGRILDSDKSAIYTYVAERLRTTHGVGLSPDGFVDGGSVRTRTEIQSEVNAFPRRGPGLRWRHTSGTTGEPFHFFREPIMEAWMNAAMWAVYAWHGVAPGVLQARIWGLPRDLRGRAAVILRDFILGRKRFDAFEITVEKCVAFLEVLRRKKVRYAYGYPYTTYEFVRRCIEAGLDGTDLQMEVVITTGENLVPAMRAAMAEFFNCPVVDEYGCTESGILAFECEKGTKHRIPVAAYLESGGEDGAPVVHPELGQSIITDLFGSRLPFLRYRLGDRIGIDEGHACPCGRGSAAVTVAHGRLATFVRMSSGKIVDSAIFMYTVPDGVHYFQARQIAIDEVEVKIVPRPGETPEGLVQECERRWSSAFRGAMTVRVEVVDLIPRNDSGKFQDFIPIGETEDGANEERELP